MNNAQLVGNSALQSQQQQVAAAGTRSIRGSIAESASNLEYIVSTRTLCIYYNIFFCLHVLIRLQ